MRPQPGAEGGGCKGGPGTPQLGRKCLLEWLFSYDFLQIHTDWHPPCGCSFVFRWLGPPQIQILVPPLFTSSFLPTEAFEYWAEDYGIINSATLFEIPSQ